MMVARKIMLFLVLQLHLHNGMLADCRRMLCRAIVLLVSLSSVSLPQNVHPAHNDTLAVIGKKAITTGRFARLYKEKLLRYGLSDNGILREGYLHNIVDDEILIACAKSQKLDRTKEALVELTRIQLQELLNAYSAKHILSHVEVTDGEILFFRISAGQ